MMPAYLDALCIALGARAAPVALLQFTEHIHDLHSSASDAVDKTPCRCECTTALLVHVGVVRRGVPKGIEVGGAVEVVALKLKGRGSVGSGGGKGTRHPC